MNLPELRTEVRQLVEPSVNRLGFDLVAVEWVGGTRGPVLRLSIDRPADRPPGVNANDCARVSDLVSPLLDEADPVAHSYTLEISSPGMERPLQRLEDFRRFLGYRVKLRLEAGHPRRRYTGRLVAVEDDQIGVEVDGVVHTLLHETIDQAHLALDLSEYQQLAEVLHDDQ